MDKVFIAFVYIAAGLIALAAVPFVPGDPVEIFQKIVPWVAILFVLAQLLTWQNLTSTWSGLRNWILKGIGIVGIIAALFLTPFGEFSWFYDTMTLVCVVLAAISIVAFYGRGVWLKRFLVLSVTFGVLTLVGNTLMHEMHRETTNLIFTFSNDANGYPKITCNQPSSIEIPENKILRIKVKGYYKYTDDQGIEHSYTPIGDGSEMIDLSETTGDQHQFNAPIGQQLLKIGEDFFPPELYDVEVMGDRYEVEIPADDNPGGRFTIRPNETRQVMQELKGKIRVRIVVLERDETTLMDYADQAGSFFWRRSNQKRGDKAVVQDNAENIYQYRRAELVAKRDELVKVSKDLPALRLEVEAELTSQAITRGEQPDQTVNATDVEKAFDTRVDKLTQEIKVISGKLITLDEERKINSKVNVIPPARNRSTSNTTASPARSTASASRSTKQTKTKPPLTVAEVVKQFPPAGNFPKTGKAMLRIRNENCDRRKLQTIVFKAVEGQWVKLATVPYGLEAIVPDTNGITDNSLVNEQYCVVFEKNGTVIPPVGIYRGKNFMSVSTKDIRESRKKTLALQEQGDEGIVLRVVCASS